MTAPLSRALLLAHDFPPMGGGIARALGALAEADPERLAVSSGRSPGADRWDRHADVTVRRVPVPAAKLRSVAGLLRWTRSAEELADEIGAGFVWAGNLKPAGYVARWLAGRRGLPYGLIVYGLDIALLKAQAATSRRRRMVARALVGGAAGTIAISRWTADQFGALAESIGIPAAGRRVRVIPLGADPDIFRPDVELGPVMARHRIGVRPWLLTVARLVPHKGIDTALAAVARLPVEVGYLVAGEGPDRLRLEALAQQLGIADRVRFLGAVSDADLPALYRAASVYVGLSREEGPEAEGFGLSLVEAQAVGRPVVASRAGGIADAVEDLVAGVLVPPDDAGAAAAAIGELLRHPGRAEELGRAGRKAVETRLNWGRVAADLAAAEREFSSEPARRAGR